MRRTWQWVHNWDASSIISWIMSHWKETVTRRSIPSFLLAQSWERSRWQMIWAVSGLGIPDKISPNCSINDIWQLYFTRASTLQVLRLGWLTRSVFLVWSFQFACHVSATSVSWKFIYFCIKVLNYGKALLHDCKRFSQVPSSLQTLQSPAHFGDIVRRPDSPAHKLDFGLPKNQLQNMVGTHTAININSTSSSKTDTSLSLNTIPTWTSMHWT